MKTSTDFSLWLCGEKCLRPPDSMPYGFSFHAFFHKSSQRVNAEIGIGGSSHLLSPATPPFMRVRIRRFSSAETPPCDDALALL
jgi:hypothetical protein